MLTVKHPWHGAHYGDNAPATVNALIEIPQGSRSKYEVDKTTGLLKLDISLAKAELGWKPAMNAREALELTLQWYKTYYQDKDRSAIR